MPGHSITLFSCAALVVALMWTGSCYGRSALSPRHSGMEPPGGPRSTEMVPGMNPGRTAEGGMGYSDAYGNTLTDKYPEEQKKRQRLRSGAYGQQSTQKERAADIPTLPQAPVWNFK